MLKLIDSWTAEWRTGYGPGVLGTIPNG